MRLIKKYFEPVCRFLLILLPLLIPGIPVYAQSPWEQAVTILQQAFTGTIARALSLVAIVVGGLMFAFGEGESKPCSPESSSAWEWPWAPPPS